MEKKVYVPTFQLYFTFYFSFSCQCFVKKFYDKDTIRLNLSLWRDIFILFAAWGWHLCHYYVEWAASDKCMKIIIDLSVNFYDFFQQCVFTDIFFWLARERELWSDSPWVVTLFWWNHLFLMLMKATQNCIFLWKLRLGRCLLHTFEIIQNSRKAIQMHAEKPISIFNATVGRRI